MIPNTTRGQADPQKDEYHKFCQKMCLWSSKYYKIKDTLEQTLPEDKEKQKGYWKDEFSERFPDGKDLEPSNYGYYRHYNKKVKFDDSDEEENNPFTTLISEPRSKTTQNNDTVTSPNAKKVNEQFYQNASDKLIAPIGDDDSVDPTLAKDEHVKQINQMSTDFIQQSTVEEDCRQWAGNYVNLDSPGLSTALEAKYTEMRKTKGRAQALPSAPNLTIKQNLVKDKILEFVTKRYNNEPVEPLRIFVIGVPKGGQNLCFPIGPI